MAQMLCPMELTFGGGGFGQIRKAVAFIPDLSALANFIVRSSG